MVQPPLNLSLPSGAELPDSDDVPVDSEDQNLIPNVLLFLLNMLWRDRQDWFFGVDMGVYHTTGGHPRVPIVPDAFLSLGVPRRRDGKSRCSYVVWEEGVVPTLVLEVVSWSPGGEYDEKFEAYRNLGVLYYLIYNHEHWKRDRHQPFELYKLIQGQYQLLTRKPCWIPEIGLGIGRFQGAVGGIEQEMLGWFKENGDRYLTPEEKVEHLAARLRELGENPEEG